MKTATLSPCPRPPPPAAAAVAGINRLTIEGSTIVAELAVNAHPSKSEKTLLLSQVNWEPVAGQLNGKSYKLQLSAYVKAGTPIDPNITTIKLNIPIGEAQPSASGKMMLVCSGKFTLDGVIYSGQPVTVSLNAGYKA